MRSVDARHRNFIGTPRASSKCKLLVVGRHTKGQVSWPAAIPMPAYAHPPVTSRNPTRWASNLAEEKPMLDLLVPRIRALVPVRRLRAALQSLVRPAAAAVPDGGWLLCHSYARPARPLSISYTLPVHFGRAMRLPIRTAWRSVDTDTGAFRRWRLSDARRGAGRDRHAARDSPRSGHCRRRDLAIVRDRLSDPAPTRPERKQPCSMSS